MDITDSIINLSINMNNAKVGTELGTCVMKKALDQMETQGAAVVEMMESANVLDTYA